MIKLSKNDFPKSLLLFFFITFGFIAGIKSYLLGYTHKYKHFFEAFQYNPTETVHNFFQKSPPNDTIHFFISNKNQLQLSRDRERRIGIVLDWIASNRKDTLLNPYKKEVNCNMYYKNDKIRAKIKIPGLIWDHFLHTKRTSLRIQIKDENNFKGTKQFNLLKPETRGYLFNYIINEITKQKNIISINYSPVQVMINGKSMGIYLFEDFFNKYLIEKNQKKDSIIFRLYPNNQNSEKKRKVKVYHPSPKKLNQSQQGLVNNIENEIGNLNNILDRDKFITLVSIGFITNSWHQFHYNNLGLYYNTHTNLIEPIIREVKPRELTFNQEVVDGKEILKRIKTLTGLNSFLSDFLIENHNNKKFIKQLEHRTDELINNYDKAISSKEFINYDSIFNTESIVSSWDLNILKKNVSKIKNSFFDKALNDDTLFFKDNKRDTIIYEGDLIIDKTITIATNEVLIINPGTKLSFSKNANLIIYGNIQMNGTENKQILIENTDSSFSSILSINANGTNKISYVHFNRLSNLNKNNWINTGALTFYETDIEINNCNFTNNLNGDDYLNIVRSSFQIKDCNFNFILNDAIDIDFSDGFINNSNFINVGNDAIDFSGSKSNVFSCNITKCGDKAISCGEISDIKIEKCDIQSSYWGIVSKDLSLVNVSNTYFLDNNYDFGIYKKKDEFGIGKLIEQNNYGVKKVCIDQYGTYESDNEKIQIVKLNNAKK